MTDTATERVVPRPMNPSYGMAPSRGMLLFYQNAAYYGMPPSYEMSFPGLTGEPRGKQRATEYPHRFAGE